MTLSTDNFILLYNRREINGISLLNYEDGMPDPNSIIVWVNMEGLIGVQKLFNYPFDRWEQVLKEIPS